MTVQGDYLKFGDELILNGAGSGSPTGATYTVKRAEGLEALPTPRVTIQQLANYPGAILGEADDDVREIKLTGEVHAPDHPTLLEELERFKYLASVQRGAQSLRWTPTGRTARMIDAIIQNNAEVVLDVEDELTAEFVLDLLCPSPYYTGITQVTVTESVTGSAQEIDVTNSGNVYTEPVIKITPTLGKSGGYAYRVWVALWNRVSAQLNHYPIQICSQDGVSGMDHAALVTAGKAQADGDDLRVEVDGVEVDIWVEGENTTQCKIWANFDFQPCAITTLNETFASGDTIASITLVDSSDFPSEGIAYNVNTGEAFVFTGNDTVLNKLTGLTRAAKGTTAAAGAVGNSIVWIEHDVWIKYGDATATAQDVPIDNRPTFIRPTSTNVLWRYVDEFGRYTGNHSAQWTRSEIEAGIAFYDEWHEGTNPITWERLGLKNTSGSSSGDGRIYLYNPCGITNFNVVAAEYYSDDDTGWVAEQYQPRLESSSNGWYWVKEYWIPFPASTSTWLSWSRDEALTSGAIYASLRVNCDYASVEVSEIDLYLDSDNTPGVALGSEQGSYDLDVVLTLVDDDGDDHALRVQMMMDVGETLEIDCEARTCTYLKDNSNQFQAITPQSPSLRAYWMRLPGYWGGGKTSSIRYDETGVSNVTVQVLYYNRWL